jgi:hypothetical protein
MYWWILPARGPLGLLCNYEQTDIGQQCISAYRLFVLISSARVVRSIDLTITRSLGVIGEFACFRGLKFRIAESILFATAGRVLIKTDSPFNVALIKMASLWLSIRGSQP